MRAAVIRSDDGPGDDAAALDRATMAILEPFRLPVAFPPPDPRAGALRSRRWRHAIAAGALLLMGTWLLVTFLQVVRGAVQQGDLRREATARHSAATWRCTAYRSIRQRDLCLDQLNARPTEMTLTPAAPE